MRMTTPDEDLARAARDGDKTAFAVLVERHYDRVFGLAFRLTGRRTDAEDLTQEVCLTLPHRLRGWRGEGRYTTWLYRVVVNAAHDARRRDMARSKAAMGWGDAEIGRRAEATDARAAQDWLQTAMAALSDDLRDTLALVLDDMSHKEAGAVLGVSEGTISWRVSEAKKALRAMKDAEE